MESEVKIEAARAALREALARRDVDALRQLLARAHPHGLAPVLPDLDVGELALLLRLLGHQEVAQLVAELHPAAAATLLRRLSRVQAADILEEMEPDDATDVLEALPVVEAEDVLRRVAPDEAEAIRQLLRYRPESAGGVMTPRFTALPPDVAVAEALRRVRRLAADREVIYYVYVTDATGHLLGVVSLRDLMLAPPQARLADVMVRDVVAVPVDADREVAARLLRQHHLLALPVVDAQRRVLGIVTADDVAEVVEEETTEDVERLGGAEPLEEPYLLAGVSRVVRKRVGWLLLLFVAEAYTGTVLRFYEDELARVVALAFFVPLLIGTGGNVGSQVTTTLVRALAVGEVGFQHLGRVLWKELRVALVLGAVMGIAAYVRSWTLGVAELGLVVGATACAVVVWATVVAVFLPLLLRRLGIDPAVVSAPLITTLVDGTGLVIYFTIARLLLGL
ncbi:MAG TPA: magnesium transporter [Chloroflexota bacterium]